MVNTCLSIHARITRAFYCLSFMGYHKRMKVTTLKPRLKTVSNRLSNANGAGQTVRVRGSRWQALRANWLRDNPLCAHCLLNSRVTLADEVDHIKPLSQGGLEFDQTNLQSLCIPCHKTKTASEATYRANQSKY
jgi:5-methylcytosine-specific restriction protein A